MDACLHVRRQDVQSLLLDVVLFGVFCFIVRFRCRDRLVTCLCVLMVILSYEPDPAKGVGQSAGLDAGQGVI